MLVARPTPRLLYLLAYVLSVDQIQVEPGLRVPKGKPIPILEVKVAGRQCIGILDSGAIINVIGPD